MIAWLWLILLIIETVRVVRKEIIRYRRLQRQKEQTT